MNRLSRFTTTFVVVFFMPAFSTFLPESGNYHPFSILGQTTVAAEQQRRDEAAREAGRRAQQMEIQRSIELMKAQSEAAMIRPLMVMAPKPKPNLAEEERKLSPAPEDRLAHAAFLGQEGTGLFRIFPAELYEATRVVSAADASEGEPVIAMEGGGGYYSFTKKTHEKGKWAEITLEGDRFRVGMNGASVAMMIELGDIQLETITLDTPAVAYLASFTPPINLRAAEEKHALIEAGIEAGNRVYRARLPAVLNTTYLLRSSNYGRSDILVAFRVVRKDPNEGLTILWKRLKKYQTPSLK